MKHLNFFNFFVPAPTIISILTIFFTQNLPAQAGSNGCGSGWTGNITPNTPAGTSFKGACDRHDKCYDTLGSNRQACDNQFHNDMLTACREAFPDGSFLGRSIRKPARITCNGAADAYYTAVRSEGGKAHQDAQRLASDKARQKKQQEIAASSNTISFKNNCSHPLQVGIHFKNLQNQWETKSWFTFSPGESARLNGVNTNNRYFYYYAKTTDGSNISWYGNETSQTIGGIAYNMKKVDTGASKVNWTQSLSCN
jgi:uncharacterized membrane protein